MKLILLTQGQVAKVCDCHYHLVEFRKWHAQWVEFTKSYRAVSNASMEEQRNGMTKRIMMHAVIAGTPKGMMTDHKDHDTLNNCCDNLRVCSESQNAMNRRMRSDNSSGYRCVYKDGLRWRAEISKNGKTFNLGRYNSAIEAAIVYDRKAIELFGEFAVLNFPLEVGIIPTSNINY